MINLGNERILFKKTGTGFFSIPSLTLSPSSASVQCAAVRTQDGWMRTPPHRNFPLLFCSIIWNKKERFDAAWSTAHKILYTVIFVVAKCPDASSTKAHHIHWSQSSTVGQKHYEWNTYKKFWIFFLNEGWLHPNHNAGHCKEALWYFKALKHRAQMRGLFLCAQHTRDSISSQAPTFMLRCKRAFNVK